VKASKAIGASVGGLAIGTGLQVAGADPVAHAICMAFSLIDPSLCVIGVVLAPVVYAALTYVTTWFAPANKG
jgi:hypothetical protein